MLAINGGKKTLELDFQPYQSLGDEEISAGYAVLKSKKLSQFLGAWHDDFYGGEQVRSFEFEFANFFGVKHAITVNSLTSGLICAVGAIGVQPGEEIIVSPWTMAASATCVLVWNAIPIFADIDPITFNLCPEKVEEKITDKTRAIILPSIFGGAADLLGFRQLAKKYNLHLIEDAAQAPGVKYKGQFVGTVGDIGGFSLNYHKHIHTGEGGVCVTNDDTLAERMRLIRNHAEAVVDKKGEKNLTNMLGFNFRLGEIEAAIGRSQLRKLKGVMAHFHRMGQRLSKRLDFLPYAQVTPVARGDTHGYYVFGINVDFKTLGISRTLVANALRSEGIPCIMESYVNIHEYQVYARQRVYGQGHYPWVLSGDNDTYRENVVSCPVAEKLQNESFLGIPFCQYHLDERHIDGIADAFIKVWSDLESIAA